MENELRRISGTGTAQQDAESDAASSANDGQGGPYTEPNVQNVDAVLNDLEKRLAVRRASLQQLKQALQVQQQEFSAGPGALERGTSS